MAIMKSCRYLSIVPLLYNVPFISITSKAFVINTHPSYIVDQNRHERSHCQLFENRNNEGLRSDDNNSSTPPSSSSSYESSDSSSKGIVSFLTDAINFISADSKNDANSEASEDPTTKSSSPPSTPQELLQRIQNDYTQNNYLWTGNIDISSFEPDCQFTDPTLSFIGVDTYLRNINNIRPIIEALIPNDDGCRSDLLDIRLCEEEGYVESRWNMVGNLTGAWWLWWNPRVDVVGRTKFWFHESSNVGDEGWRVYFYDEKWDIAAGKALLQLVIPGGK